MNSCPALTAEGQQGQHIWQVVSDFVELEPAVEDGQLLTIAHRTAHERCKWCRDDRLTEIYTDKRYTQESNR